MNIVYRTENLVNNKFYYGVHNSNEEDGYLGSGRLIKQAISKYGKENFKRRTIKEFENIEDAYALEALIVDEDFQNREDCYNLQLGGVGGAKHSDATKKLMSEAKKGKEPWNKNLKGHQTAWNKGLKVTTNVPTKEHMDMLHETRRKQVVDETGKIYSSAKEAAEELGLVYGSLVQQLNGRRRNKTNLKYVIK